MVGRGSARPAPRRGKSGIYTACAISTGLYLALAVRPVSRCAVRVISECPSSGVDAPEDRSGWPGWWRVRQMATELPELIDDGRWASGL